MMRIRLIPFLVFILGGIFGIPVSGLAGVVVTDLHRSPDISLIQSGLLVNDQDAVLDGPVLADLGALPQSADVTAYHVQANGDRLFALDTTALLAGGILARPGDVIRYDGVDYHVEFDGLANGLAPGARIDALTMNSSGQLLLSFDVTVSLSGLVFADEDLVRFDGGSFHAFFDGSAAGIDTSLDLNGVHFDFDRNVLLISFDGNGTVSGVTFSDEDVLSLVLLTSIWNLAYNGSAESEWVSADLDAFYAIVEVQDLFKDGFE